MPWNFINKQGKKPQEFVKSKEGNKESPWLMWVHIPGWLDLLGQPDISQPTN